MVQSEGSTWKLLLQWKLNIFKKQIKRTWLWLVGFSRKNDHPSIFYHSYARVFWSTEFFLCRKDRGVFGFKTIRAFFKQQPTQIYKNRYFVHERIYIKESYQILLLQTIKSKVEKLEGSYEIDSTCRNDNLLTSRRLDIPLRLRKS